jgi:hypothetical protein
MRPLLDRLMTAALARVQYALQLSTQGLSGRTAADATPPPADQDVRRIQLAYASWCKEQPARLQQEEAQPQREQQQQAFSEQTGYVCFVGLLLARVLEDKAIGPGFASGATRACWLQALHAASAKRQGRTASLPHIYQQIARLYRRLCRQEASAWFEPDDALLALILHHLRRFSFSEISNDLPGFIYQALIARGVRNQRGHFLTSPEIVEFMLDRAGYNSQTIIGASLLDPSCGSGSFLVHAARRLRREIHTTLARRPPGERARRYIEQVQTTLIGLEIDPFACYLARLNLFIQILDDLALLWRGKESPVVTRFAIYTTDSLDMPLRPSPAETMPAGLPALAETPLLDEATAIKDLAQHFRYILCNPPYINRGIILHAQRYADHPFYREVVKGDENFSLLFLRLATYYLAPGGTLCFICPLNLLGDESTMRTREMFNQEEHWRLRSITRFYSRTALFPGVLQGVCVIRIDRTPVQAADTIELRAGSVVAEAGQQSVQIAYPRVTHNYPPQTTWSKPWLVHTQPEVYDLWEQVRHQSQQNLGALLAGKLTVTKGDVRSTWAQPLRAPASEPGTIPVTKGANIEEWGGWSAAAHLDPTAVVPPTTVTYTSSLWVQKRVQRIANLTHPETVLLLKEVAGLEMQRPIRGTMASRNASHPFVADETVLVMYTCQPAYENLACAVFGLLTSACYNFFFNLFSTNAHANMKEILRLPVPAWNADLERRLAAATRAVLHLVREQLVRQSETGHTAPQRELAARQYLDEQIIEAYGLQQATWQRLIGAGLPWTRGASRSTR